MRTVEHKYELLSGRSIASMSGDNNKS